MVIYHTFPHSLFLLQYIGHQDYRRATVDGDEDDDEMVVVVVVVVMRVVVVGRRQVIPYPFSSS